MSSTSSRMSSGCWCRFGCAARRCRLVDGAVAVAVENLDANDDERTVTTRTIVFASINCSYSSKRLYGYGRGCSLARLYARLLLSSGLFGNIFFWLVTFCVDESFKIRCEHNKNKKILNLLKLK